MGILARALGGALIRQAPKRADMQIANIDLRTSARSIEAIQKAGKENAIKLATITPIISKPGKVDQNVAGNLGHQLGQVINDAEMLKQIAPTIKEAAKAYVEGEKTRADIVSSVSSAVQQGAVINAKAQADAMLGHVGATIGVNKHRARYGGLSA